MTDHWTDPASGLMWTAADDGIGVTFSQANYYCQTLSLSGYKNWTLPTIEELQAFSAAPPTPEASASPPR